MKKTISASALVALVGVPALVASCECSSTAELEYEVIQTLRHDSTAYTQGLLVHDGSLFESTGQYGRSSLRRVEIATGRVLDRHDLADDHFGEGLALVGDRLVQLTWKAGLAFVYELETLAPVDTFTYEGEGWGLCHDGERLVMSDGSSSLDMRDPATFELTGSLRVTRDGYSVSGLNELECVNGHVFANVYQSHEIVRIEMATGRVTGVIDAYSLGLRAGRPTDTDAVLNGIAYDGESGTFYLTGKLWPRLFGVAIEGHLPDR